MIELEDGVLLARRVAAAVRLVGADSAAAARIAEAAPGYLLAHDSSDVARHGALLSPVPDPARVRVAVTPRRSAGEWQLDVAARDRPGLLAAFTGVLAGRQIDVVQAVLATWSDGAALEAFAVRSVSPPDAGSLQAAFEAALCVPQSSPPLPDATVEFDRGASALYTACEVRATDRPGLLHALAVAFAAAGADVHAARVVTVDGQACDRFDLSDAAGRKLDAGVERAIQSHVREGVVTRPPRPPRPWPRWRPRVRQRF